MTSSEVIFLKHNHFLFLFSDLLSIFCQDEKMERLGVQFDSDSEIDSLISSYHFRRILSGKS